MIKGILHEVRTKWGEDCDQNSQEYGKVKNPPIWSYINHDPFQDRKIEELAFGVQLIMR